MSIIYLFSALLLGLSVTKRLGLKLFRFETPGLAIAFGLLLWTWLSFIIALFMPYDLSLPVTIGLAAVASILLAWKSPVWQFKPVPGGKPAIVAITTFSWIS